MAIPWSYLRDELRNLFDRGAFGVYVGVHLNLRYTECVVGKRGNPNPNIDVFYTIGIRNQFFGPFNELLTGDFAYGDGHFSVRHFLIIHLNFLLSGHHFTKRLSLNVFLSFKARLIARSIPLLLFR